MCPHKPNMFNLPFLKTLQDHLNRGLRLRWALNKPLDLLSHSTLNSLSHQPTVTIFRHSGQKNQFGRCEIKISKQIQEKRGCYLENLQIMEHELCKGQQCLRTMNERSLKDKFR